MGMIVVHGCDKYAPMCFARRKTTWYFLHCHNCQLTCQFSAHLRCDESRWYTRNSIRISVQLHSIHAGTRRTVSTCKHHPGMCGGYLEILATTDYGTILWVGQNTPVNVLTDVVFVLKRGVVTPKTYILYVDQIHFHIMCLGVAHIDHEAPALADRGELNCTDKLQSVP